MNPIYLYNTQMELVATIDFPGLDEPDIVQLGDDLFQKTEFPNYTMIIPHVLDSMRRIERD